MIWRGDKNLIGSEHPLPFWDLTLIQSALFLLLFFPPHTSSGERGRSPDSAPENLIIGLTLKIKRSLFSPHNKGELKGFTYLLEAQFIIIIIIIIVIAVVVSVSVISCFDF